MSLLLLSAASAAPVLAPHARHVAEFGADAAPPGLVPRAMLPPVTPGPDLRVYGYLAYWDNELTTLRWDDLTDVAIFSAGANDDGTLYDTWKWDLADEAVAIAEPYGVRVDLVVTNFDSGSLEALLSSASARNTLIDELVAWKASTGADGVNIDFEGLPVSVKDEFVTFITDLEAAIGEGEVSLAAPAVDWAGAFDYSSLSEHADLFIMGYGYHWSGSSYAGPSDPLYAGSGTIWSGINSYSLSWTVADYLSYDADPDRVILGLPLYGESWPVAGGGVPEPTLSPSSSVTYEVAWDLAAEQGRQWEPDSHTPWTYGGGEQLWYGDEESVRERIAFVRDETELVGIGFWALHYDGDDPAFWDMIHTETTFDVSSGTTTSPGTTSTTPDATTTGGATAPSTYRADAGQPFLAYVGDMVVLNGSGSTGPEPLEYRWAQVAGPTVALTSDTDVEPAFRVETPGTHVFELLVGDGTTWSAPASSYVIVLDPGLPKRLDSGCGCGGGAQPAGIALSLAAFALIFRRAGQKRAGCSLDNEKVPTV